MKKGDVVIVRAYALTSYNDMETLGAELVHCPKGTWKSKKLYRQKAHEPWTGLVVGTSYRATGHYDSGATDMYSTPDPPYLIEDKRHPVVMVQRLDTERWLRPVACFDADLETPPNA